MFRKDALSYKPGDIVGGRYKVTGSLGRGGFGCVYSAQHTMTGQPMALKMLTIDPSSTDDDIVARFYREARITAQLTDVHTVRVFDVGEADNGPLFMAMEMLRGPPLDKLLRRLSHADRAMTEAETIDIALPILQSLSEAHKAGLVHRDLKPANIILAHKGDEQMVVKVLDFGIARTQDSSLTGQGKALGTPAYMSPEQVKGKLLDGRSDLYSLGIIMYRCLTGRMPFENDDPFAQAFMHITEPVPDPRATDVKMSDAIAEIVMRAMSKEPDERFADSRVMRRALQELRGGAWAGTSIVAKSGLARTAMATTGDLESGGGDEPTSGQMGTPSGEFGGALMGLLVDVQHESLLTPQAVIEAYSETEDEETRVQSDHSEDDKPTSFVTSPTEEKLRALGTNSPSNVETRALDIDDASPATLAVTAEELDALRSARQKAAAPKSKTALYVGIGAALLAAAVGAGVLIGGSGDGAPDSAAASGNAAKSGAAADKAVADKAATDKAVADKAVADKAAADKAVADKAAADKATADKATAADDNASALQRHENARAAAQLVARATKEPEAHAKQVLLEQAVRLDPNNAAYPALLEAARKSTQRASRAASLRPRARRDRRRPTNDEPKAQPAAAPPPPPPPPARPKKRPKPKKPTSDEPYVDF